MFSSIAKHETLMGEDKWNTSFGVKEFIESLSEKLGDGMVF